MTVDHLGTTKLGAIPYPVCPDCGGGGSVDLTPSAFSAASGQTFAFDGPGGTVSLEQMPDAVSRTDQFTVAAGSLVCDAPGVYMVNLSVNAQTTDAPDTPGPVEVAFAVSVNSEGEGPAYFFYPAAAAYAAAGGQTLSTVAFSFPQVLNAEDIVDVVLYPNVVAGTDMGEAGVSVQSLSLLLTRIGDVP